MNIIRTISFFILAVIPSVCHAQQLNNWDETLDRYELICERCLELRRAQEEGKSIPKESISSLKTQLAMLRNSLLQVQGQMSAAQKARFDMIRQRFGDNAASKAAEKVNSKAASVSVEGKRKVPEAPETAMAPEAAAVQVPAAISTKSRPVFEKIDKIEGLEIADTARMLVPDALITCSARKYGYGIPKPSTNYMVGLQASVYPLQSYGMMLGALFDSRDQIFLGAYIKGLSDFRFKPVVPSYSCNSNGVMPDGKKIWSNGETASRRFSVTAGGIMRIGSHCGFNLGIGYGSTRYFIKDVNGNWAGVSDISISGVVAETGVVFFWGKNIWAGVGASTTVFHSIEPYITIGFVF